MTISPSPTTSLLNLQSNSAKKLDIVEQDLSARSSIDYLASSGIQTPVTSDPGKRTFLGTAKEIDESAVIAEGEEKITWFVYGLVATAAVAGLLFGYDTGVISGTLVVIGDDLGPTVLSSGQKELITSATTLGALFGGLAAGLGSDVVGRKWVLALANAVFIGGAVGQAVCHSVWGMIGGRFVIGVGVGLASCIVPLYIGELSPTLLRGRLVTVNVVAITLGQVIAYAIGAAFANVHNGWRYMVGLGAVPAGLDLIFLFWLPESPRILLRQGRFAEAEGILGRIYSSASPEQVKQKLALLEAGVAQSRGIVEKTTFWERFKGTFTVGMNRRALIIGCGLQAFQQLCGFNTLMYYSSTLFKSVGFDNPTATGLVIAAVNFLFTMLALRIVDPIGRRKVMVFSAPGMIISLVLAAISFHFLTSKTGGKLIEGTEYSTKWAALVLVWMITYTASYAAGLGNIPWQQGELFRLEVRGIGTSLCTATNWAANLLIGSTFLSLMDRITPAGAFGLYAGFCFIGWVFCVFLYPETSGLSLEEVFYIFEEDFGVKRSAALRAEKKAIREGQSGITAVA